MKKKKISFRQNRRAYEAAQENEKLDFLALAWDLCTGDPAAERTAAVANPAHSVLSVAEGLLWDVVPAIHVGPQNSRQAGVDLSDPLVEVGFQVFWHGCSSAAPSSTNH